MHLKRYPVKKKENPKCFKPGEKNDTDSPRLRVEKSEMGTEKPRKRETETPKKKPPREHKKKES